MEITILKFDDSHGAQLALGDVIDAQGERSPWLHEVAVIARPLIGRVRVSVAFPDGKSKTFHEGDLADVVGDLGGLTGYFASALAGPLGSMIGAVNASMMAGTLGDEAEQRLFHLDALKDELPRDSSALVLLANESVSNAFAELFEGYKPKVIRRDAGQELRKRLEALHDRVVQAARKAEQEAQPSAP